MASAAPDCQFETIAKSIAVPAILYNIPGRTGINFLPESILELLDRAPNIVAIKEATGDIAQMMRVIELCGDRLTLLAGTLPADNKPAAGDRTQEEH